MRGSAQTILFASLILVTVLVASSVRGVDAQQIQSSAQAIPRDTLITLERTGCFGPCPIYKLKITADGSVTFEGRQFVKHIGRTRAAISRQQVRRLLEQFDEIKFFNLEDCESVVTDHRSAITSITLNGRSKTVTHDFGCRSSNVLAKLSKLEQDID